MSAPRVRRALAAMAIALAVPALLAAQDTGPVQRPVSGAPRPRLQAPANIRVDQGRDGDIRLRWDPVPGAKQYNLGRAVGNEGFRRVEQGPVYVAEFIDRDVRAGMRTVYTITPIDSSGVSGIRATSEPFFPTARAAYQAPATPAVTATRDGSDRVRLSWSRGDAVTRTEIYRVHNGAPTIRVGNREGSMPREFLVTDLPPGQHQFAVRHVNETGMQSAPGISNIVTIDGSATTTPETTPGPTTSTAATEEAGGAVLVTMAAPITLRVGATHALAGIAGGGWTSLSPAIASVTSTGTVTARAAGVAQLATLGADAGGAVRVTVVRVRVTP